MFCLQRAETGQSYSFIHSSFDRGPDRLEKVLLEVVPSGRVPEVKTRAADLPPGRPCSRRPVAGNFLEQGARRAGPLVLLGCRGCWSPLHPPPSSPHPEGNAGLERRSPEPLPAPGRSRVQQPRPLWAVSPDSPRPISSPLSHRRSWWWREVTPPPQHMVGNKTHPHANQL